MRLGIYRAANEIVKIFQFYLSLRHIHYWCKRKFTKKECITMASNKSVVPEAKEALNRFKMEAASEVGVFLH